MYENARFESFAVEYRNVMNCRLVEDICDPVVTESYSWLFIIVDPAIIIFVLVELIIVTFVAVRFSSLELIIVEMFMFDVVMFESWTKE